MSELQRALINFEAESWRDLALIPYWIARYLFAWIWYRLFCLWLNIAWKLGRSTLVGRHNLPEPIICSECLWAGPRRWLYHGYGDDGSGYDVEPRDECPRCGNEL